MDYLTDEQRDLRNKILYTGAGLAALGGIGYGLHKLTKKPASVVAQTVASHTSPVKPLTVKATRTPAQTKADYLQKNVPLVILRGKAVHIKNALDKIKGNMLKDKGVVTTIDYKRGFYEPLVRGVIEDLKDLPLPDQADLLHPFMPKYISYDKLVDNKATLDDMAGLITSNMINAAQRAGK